MSKLTKYEQKEIKKYKKYGIYYTGHLAEKIEPTDFKAKAFDDEDGYYKIMNGDHIRYRYQIRQELGQGAYGTVIHAYDHKNAMNVAIKIMRKYKGTSFFESEERILKHINKNMRKGDHIVRLFTSFKFRTHKCLVMEFLHENLKDHIDQNGRRPMHLVRNLGHDILRALKFLHKFKIIHGDIKPANIVFQSASKHHFKLIDFGCSYIEKGEVIAAYMGTRKYRAPEVLLRIRFSRAFDIWSLAVTLCEAFTGESMFEAINEEDMIVQIVEVIGDPPQDLLSNWREVSQTAFKYFLPKGRLRYSTLKNPEDTLGWFGGEPLTRTLDMLIDKEQNPLFLDFIEECLLWDANVRISANEGLHHHWIREPHAL